MIARLAFVRLLAASVCLHSDAPSSSLAAMLHAKARQETYQGGTKRFPVPDDKVAWSVDWPEYLPVDYTAPSVLAGPVWADVDFR